MKILCRPGDFACGLCLGKVSPRLAIRTIPEWRPVMRTPSLKLFKRSVAATLLSACSLLLLDASSVVAQQTTGVPGAPNATTTIDGNYIPNPPHEFGGAIGLDSTELQSALQARHVR